MSAGAGPFASFVLRLRQGEDAAFRELLATCAGLLRHLAYRRLSRLLRATVGIDDVVQTAWMLFVKGLPRFDLPSEDRLRGLLCVIAYRSVRSIYRHYFSGKHLTDQGRVSLEAAAAEDEAAFLAKGPSPQEVACSKEFWDILLLLRPDLAEPVAMLRVGFRVSEVAAGLRLSGRWLRCTLRQYTSCLKDAA
jgi:DNA-directed RNA polymerase specialized sigma24 family protein